MSDDLVKRLRAYEGKGFETTACYNGTRSEAADRIAELEAKLQDAEQRGYANAMEAERKLHEDRIEELEGQLKTVLDRETSIFRRYDAKLDAAEAKLAEAVDELEAWLELEAHCSIEEGVCCCGEYMENHSLSMDSGHTPLDHGTYIAGHLEKTTRIAIAKIKGEQP